MCTDLRPSMRAESLRCFGSSPRGRRVALEWAERGPGNDQPPLCTSRSAFRLSPHRLGTLPEAESASDTSYYWTQAPIGNRASARQGPGAGRFRTDRLRRDAGRGSGRPGQALSRYSSRKVGGKRRRVRRLTAIGRRYSLRIRAHLARFAIV
jgi:hypothetical protein